MRKNFVIYAKKDLVLMMAKKKKKNLKIIVIIMEKTEISAI